MRARRLHLVRSAAVLAVGTGIGLGFGCGLLTLAPSSSGPAGVTALPAELVVGRRLLLPLPIPEPSPEGARQRADEILAEREFQQGLDEPFVTKVRRWLQTQFVKLLSNLFSGGGGAVATWLLVALIVGGIAYFASRLLRTVRPDPGVRLAAITDVRRHPDAWRRDAERFEQAGDWKEALRCRFRALVGELVERGTIADVPGRTAGEYRREVRDAAPLIAGGFAEATELFERAWYGDEPTGPAENERIRALTDRVLSEVGR